jgi:AcrR family transcriptional regulator
MSAGDQPSQESPIDPWRRVATGRDRRRYELFMLAAPVFAKHGFKGATVRALAHACHLSPAGLYHYFDSKEELATHALRSPRAGWDATFVEPGRDPLVQLREMLELAVGQLQVYMLSLRMLQEIGDPSAARIRQATFREGEQMIGRFVNAAAPALQREAALELARLLIAVFVGSAVSGLDSEAPALRARAAGLLRDRLVPTHVDPEHFRRVMGDWSA